MLNLLSNYRYGFNGQEKDDEAKGGGNSYDFGDRAFDPRTARFASQDRLTSLFAWQSPYAYSMNSPITVTDYYGLGPRFANKRKSQDAESAVSVSAALNNDVVPAIAPSHPTTVFIVGNINGLTEEQVQTSGVCNDPKTSTLAPNFISCKGNYQSAIIPITAGQATFWYNDHNVYDRFQVINPETGTVLYDSDDEGRAKNSNNTFKSSLGTSPDSKHPKNLTVNSSSGGWKKTTIPGIDPVTGNPVTQIQVRVTAWQDASSSIHNIPVNSHSKEENKKLSVWGYDVETPPQENNESHCNPRIMQHCCFVSGTMILMADGSYRSIETIQKGDVIQTISLGTYKIQNDTVTRVSKPMNSDIVQIVFSDSTKNANTSDHAYWTVGKGWCSVKPDQTIERYNIYSQKLKIGDKVYKMKDGSLIPITVVKIIPYNLGVIQTYNVFTNSDNHAYFANGVIVHDEAVKQENR